MNYDLISTNENIWSIEDLQDKIKNKLENIFSFYNEQEFLDEIHGIQSNLDEAQINK